MGAAAEELLFEVALVAVLRTPAVKVVEGLAALATTGAAVAPSPVTSEVVPFDTVVLGKPLTLMPLALRMPPTRPPESMKVLAPAAASGAALIEVVAAADGLAAVPDPVGVGAEELDAR